MSLNNKLESAKTWVENSIRTERLAHAYLLAGHPSETLPFAKFFLSRIMALETKDRAKADLIERQVHNRSHPDIIWLEPESRRREIKIDPVRDLNKKMSDTSYLGGWKAAVIVDADRLRQEAANAFLKTLEEPPQKSILLLLSEHPDELLPTIRSRCQYILLSQGAQAHEIEYSRELLAILRQGHPADPLYALKMGSQLQCLLDDARQKASELEVAPEDDARKAEKEVYQARISTKVIEARHAIMQWFIMWHRDVMMCVLDADRQTLHFPEEIEHLSKQAEGLSYLGARKIVEEADSLARRLNKNIPDYMLLNDSLLTQAAIAYRSRAGKL